MPLSSPDSDKGAWQGAPVSQIHISQSSLSNIESATGTLDLQASRLRRVYFFCPETARLIAAHAYRVRP
jgi:hypothetical protein